MLRCNTRARLATAVRNRRLRHHVPLERIAGDLGLSGNTISLWELGQRFRMGRHVERFGEYTGLPPCGCCASGQTSASRRIARWRRGKGRRPPFFCPPVICNFKLKTATGRLRSLRQVFFQAVRVWI